MNQSSKARKNFNAALNIFMERNNRSASVLKLFNND
jgi:hypothetical protein